MYFPVCLFKCCTNNLNFPKLLKQISQTNSSSLSFKSKLKWSITFTLSFSKLSTLKLSASNSIFWWSMLVTSNWLKSDCCSSKLELSKLSVRISFSSGPPNESLSIFSPFSFNSVLIAFWFTLQYLILLCTIFKCFFKPFKSTNTFKFLKEPSLPYVLEKYLCKSHKFSVVASCSVLLCDKQTAKHSFQIFHKIYTSSYLCRLYFVASSEADLYLRNNKQLAQTGLVIPTKRPVR